MFTFTDVYTDHATGQLTMFDRAHLRLGGDHSRRAKSIKTAVNPRQTQMKSTVKAVFTPTHADTLGSLLNQPLAGAFNLAVANRQSGTEAGERLHFLFSAVSP